MVYNIVFLKYVSIDVFFLDVQVSHSIEHRPQARMSFWNPEDSASMFSQKNLKVLHFDIGSTFVFGTAKRVLSDLQKKEALLTDSFDNILNCR